MEYRFNLGVLEGSLTSSLGEHDCKFIPVSMSNNSSRRLQIATGGPRIKNQAALKRTKNKRSSKLHENPTDNIPLQTW